METEHPSSGITSATTESDPNQSHRIGRRRPLKRGVEVTVRKGTLGLGPNLAISAVEMSDDGVQVKVKSEFKVDDEIEVTLTPVGRSKPVPFVADVRWCGRDETDPTGRTFLIGAQFRHRLTFAVLSQFV